MASGDLSESAGWASPRTHNNVVRSYFAGLETTFQ
jgi:hypothetical protein